MSLIYQIARIIICKLQYYKKVLLFSRFHLFSNSRAEIVKFFRWYIFWSKRWHQKDILKLTDLYYATTLVTKGSFCFLLFLGDSFIKATIFATNMQFVFLLLKFVFHFKSIIFRKCDVFFESPKKKNIPNHYPELEI